jgi:hypothetical protein
MPPVQVPAPPQKNDDAAWAWAALVSVRSPTSNLLTMLLGDDVNELADPQTPPDGISSRFAPFHDIASGL